MTRSRPAAQPGIGVVAPYDFALDRELCRWAAPEVTLHLIARLEAELGVAVLTANEVTMWAAHARLALSTVGAGQRLVSPTLARTG